MGWESSHNIGKLDKGWINRVSLKYSREMVVLYKYLTDAFDNKLRLFLIH